VTQGSGNTWGHHAGVQGGDAPAHNSLEGSSGTGRRKAEHFVVEAIDPEPGGQSARQRYQEGAGTVMVGDRHVWGTPSSHKAGQMGTRKYEGRTRARHSPGI